MFNPNTAGLFSLFSMRQHFLGHDYHPDWNVTTFKEPAYHPLPTPNPHPCPWRALGCAFHLVKLSDPQQEKDREISPSLPPSPIVLGVFSPTLASGSDHFSLAIKQGSEPAIQLYWIHWLLCTQGYIPCPSGGCCSPGNWAALCPCVPWCGEHLETLCKWLSPSTERSFTLQTSSQSALLLHWHLLGNVNIIPGPAHQWGLFAPIFPCSQIYIILHFTQNNFILK